MIFHLGTAAPARKNKSSAKILVLDKIIAAGLAIFLISFLAAVSLSVFSASAAVPSLVPAECTGNQYDAGACNLCSFIKIFINGADIIVGLSGVFLILMFIFGGVVMITAYGSESRVKWGKDTLIAAVVGMVIVMLAWTLINTIIYSFYGVVSPATNAAYNQFTGKPLGQWGVCSFSDVPAVK